MTDRRLPGLAWRWVAQNRPTPEPPPNPPPSSHPPIRCGASSRSTARRCSGNTSTSIRRRHTSAFCTTPARYVRFYGIARGMTIYHGGCFCKMLAIPSHSTHPSSHPPPIPPQNSSWTGSAGTWSSTKKCCRRPGAPLRRWRPTYVVSLCVCPRLVCICMYVCVQCKMSAMLRYQPSFPTHQSTREQQVEEGLSRMDCHALAHGNFEVGYR